MKRRKLSKPLDMSPNLTPLIDVVMCLIIFFMLAAKIGVQRGEDSSIKLPTSVKGNDLPSLSNTVTLNVLAPASGDDPVITTLDTRGGTLIHLPLPDTTLAQWIGSAKNNNPEFKIIIRADENLDYRFLQPVLAAASEARVKGIHLATKKPEKSE